MAKAGWAPAEVVDTSVKDGQWEDVWGGQCQLGNSSLH